MAPQPLLLRSGVSSLPVTPASPEDDPIQRLRTASSQRINVTALTRTSEGNLRVLGVKLSPEQSENGGLPNRLYSLGKAVPTREVAFFAWCNQ